MQTSYWGLQGQAPQAQKTEGSGFMVSGYAVWGVGFVALTEEKKAEVEARAFYVHTFTLRLHLR